jgi:putative iron-dependent peroxidase
MPDPQPGINAPQTSAAIFLVLQVRQGAERAAAVREAAANLPALIRSIGARDLSAGLHCIIGFGSEAWDRLFGPARPADLHSFRELRAGPRVAPATHGDILLHIFAERTDMCFELATRFAGDLADAAAVIDEVHGFRYFDDRDLIGFVDGTENPSGAASVAFTITGDEDPLFAGGSYIVTQKYLHDLTKWAGQPTENQERIIGRTKLDDIELDDAVKPSYAHNALTTLVEDGQEIKILRHNMPFGNAAAGESGTFFIGYARSPRPIEQMLENMVIGRPPGNYDRLLDFTHPITGTNFFAPSLDFLAEIASATQPAPPAPPAPTDPAPETPTLRGERAGTLQIGSLRGVPQHE